MQIRRVFSTHVWYEDLAIVGRCVIGDGFYRFTLSNRFSGELLEGWCVGRGDLDWPEALKDWRAYVGKFIKRLEEGKQLNGKDRGPFDLAFAKKYPATAEYLSLEADAGVPRLTSTMLLSVDGGRWRACFRDRDNDQVMWVTGDSLEELLGSIERRLSGAETPDWRADRYAPKRGTKR